MRVSLFITCFNDTIFPQTGRAVVRLLERLGHAVDFPMEQTCCGQMHYNTGYQREAIPLVRRFVEVFETPRSSSRRRPRASGWSATCTRRPPNWPRTALAEESRRSRREVFELSEFLVNELGVEDVGAYYPAPRHLSPDLPLAADAPRRRRAVAAAAGGPRDRPGRAAPGGGMLRVRRDVRGQERGHVDGHARHKLRCILDTRAEICASADNSCLMQIGGALHRQRAGVGTVHLAEILAVDRGGRPWPRSRACRLRRAVPFPSRPSSRWRTRSSAATWARRPRRSAASAAAVVEEMPDWEALREAGRAIKERTLRHLDKYLIQFEEPVTKAGGHVHWARDAAEAKGIVREIAQAHGAREVIKVKSLTTDEIGLNEELAAVGIAAIETDLAELIVQLAGDRSSHILVPGDPQEPLRDPRTVPARRSASAT